MPLSQLRPQFVMQDDPARFQPTIPCRKSNEIPVIYQSNKWALMTTPLVFTGNTIPLPIHLGVRAVLQKPGCLFAGGHLGAMLSAITLVALGRLQRDLTEAAVTAANGGGRPGVLRLGRETRIDGKETGEHQQGNELAAPAALAAPVGVNSRSGRGGLWRLTCRPK